MQFLWYVFDSLSGNKYFEKDMLWNILINITRIECNVWWIYSDNSALSIQEAIYKLYTCLWSIVTYNVFTDCHWTPLLLWEDHYINEHSHVILSHVRDKKCCLCMLQCPMVHDNTVDSVKHHNQFLLICLITFRFIIPYKIHNVSNIPCNNNSSSYSVVACIYCRQHVQWNTK